MPTITHFDIPVGDVERAKKFYADIFDWRFEKVPPSHGSHFIITYA